MQELGKFNFKINVILNVLEKYMSFSPDNKLFFIDSFKILSTLLNSLVKNLGKNDFKHLNQQYKSKVLLDLDNDSIPTNTCLVLKSLTHSTPLANFGCHLNFTQLLDKQEEKLLNFLWMPLRCYCMTTSKCYFCLRYI